MGEGLGRMVYISRVCYNNQTWEIAASEIGITEVRCRNTFLHAKENEISRQAAQQLEAYWNGTLTRFQVPLDLSGTDFQKRVWNALQEIPYGSSVCYSELACRIGRPEAVRAVAGAVGKNPCLIIVPCHRVLGKDGSLTGFSAGLEIKKQLLNLEHIPYIDKKNRSK